MTTFTVNIGNGGLVPVINGCYLKSISASVSNEWDSLMEDRKESGAGRESRSIQIKLPIGRNFQEGAEK